MYLCQVCGVAFDEPLKIRRREYLGEWHESSIEAVCPVCNHPYFSAAALCECGEYRPVEAILCNKCKAGLLEKVTAFFDELTAEEEEQFDLWMDGDSITNRKKWGGHIHVG